MLDERFVSLIISYMFPHKVFVLNINPQTRRKGDENSKNLTKRLPAEHIK